MSEYVYENIFVSENLKRLREYCCFTQQYIADNLYIDRSTYSYWELGRTNPSVVFITAIINFYRKRNIMIDYNLFLGDFISFFCISEIDKNHNSNFEGVKPI